MNKLAVKHQILVIGAIFMLTIVLFYFFAWTPQTTKLEDLKKEAKAEKKKITDAKAKVAMLSEVKKDAANAEVELIKIQNKMPTEAQLPSLIVELQNIADDAGVELASIKPSKPKSMGKYSTIDFNLSIVGSYVTLLDFLRRIERAPRAMTVNSIDIAVATYPDLVLNFTVSAFMMDAKGNPATASAAKKSAPSASEPKKTSSNTQLNPNKPVESARTVQTAEADHASQTNQASEKTVAR